MDIDLLSKMIAELIVDHDTVGLPGVGTFYTEVVPSTFSDRGYTINPPYRRLSFLPNAVENDLLVNFYSDVNGTPADMAREYIVQFLRELAEALKEHKTITLPGLGRLRATKENNFFFVADEDLDIYPEAFGLAPVSLKNIPGLDDDKVDIRFEFKPPVRKAEKPGPAEPGPSVSAERPGPAEPEPSVPAEPLSATAPEAAEPSAAAAEPVFGAGTSADAKTAADAETAAMQETASESAAGAEVSSGTDATAEPAGTAVTAEPSVVVERAASAEPAAAAEPEAEAPEAAVAGEGAAEPSVAVERAVSAEAVVLPEAASGPETAEPAAAGPEASVPEPEAEAPKAAVTGEGTAEPAEPEALADAAEEARAAEEDTGQPVKKFRWWIPLLVLSALAAIFLAVFLILAHVAPDFIDSILYTPEELRIINY